MASEPHTIFTPDIELLADVDLLIAATALVHGLTLISYHRHHFERIPDLRLYTVT